MKHKWYNEIVAWASGAEIEQADIREVANPHWYDCDNPPKWDTTFYQFRIKPTPKKPQYLYVYKMMTNEGLKIQFWDSKTYNNESYIGKIKLEVE